VSALPKNERPDHLVSVARIRLGLLREEEAGTAKIGMKASCGAAGGNHPGGTLRPSAMLNDVLRSGSSCRRRSQTHERAGNLQFIRRRGRGRLNARPSQDRAG
jgi:hypothetical protein